MKKMFLFAGDQKVEHLNSIDPEHFFKIANRAPIDAFATQLGLIESYGQDYKDVNYLVKLNSKTNLVQTSQRDPISLAMHTVDDVLLFKKKSRLKILGVGYTIYLGSEFEYKMLREAAQVIRQAHENGLIAVLWAYPRGKAVKDERDPDLIAGAAGVAACLGADFVKVNSPKGNSPEERAELLKKVVASAGRTGVICSGGPRVDGEEFLAELKAQVKIGGAVGCAVGRNIHEKGVGEAVDFCTKIAGIVNH